MATEALSTIQGISGKTIPVYDANYDNAKMDQEDFLRVLLTQFKFQDPFETQDISKFIEDTVKLRELEVMQNFEESVQALNDNNTLFLTATNLIGQKILYKGDLAYVENGTTHVEFRPSSNVTKATLYLYDADGKIVAQKSFSNLSAGQTYSFDPNDLEVPDGYYKVKVVAQNDEGTVEVDTFTIAKVDGIQKDEGNIVALVGDKKIFVSDIVRIGG